MALENAKRILEQIMKDKTLFARMTGQEPPNSWRSKELGFDVTAEKLYEAVQTLRQIAAKAPKELWPDELDKAAGGAIWTGEDAPDSHEMGCAIFYHKRDYGEEDDVWCNQKWYCKDSFETL